MKCELCGEEGSLLEAKHKEKGSIMVCRNCWSNLYNKNSMVAGKGESSTNTSSCPACGI